MFFFNLAIFVKKRDLSKTAKNILIADIFNYALKELHLIRITPYLEFRQKMAPPITATDLNPMLVEGGTNFP